MCIIIGKWFPDKGWVGIKNRDRNYVPEISFKKNTSDGVEILYFWDDITQYCEGLNSAGVCVLSASLMVKDDEKEITVRAKQPSKDGVKIKKALKYPDVRACAMSLIKQKLPGNTLVFDKNTMILIEGCWRPGEYKSGGYAYKVRMVPRTETIIRTNHGILLPWAGYQRGDDQNQTLSRVSSESRRTIAQLACRGCKSPLDILDNLTQDYTGNGQLNALRTTTSRKKMRTTSQILIVPQDRTMFVRPLQSHMDYNFWKLNHPTQQTWVEIISNRVLYDNLNDIELDRKPPFQKNLNHKTK